MRFTAVTIPRPSLITAATLSMYGQASVGSDWLTRVLAHDVDDSGDFDGAGCDIFNRVDNVGTAAVVDWDPASWLTGQFNASPDISAVVQEIIDRGGWSSGNALTILWDEDNSPANTDLQADDFDAASANAPTLDIDFSPQGGGRPVRSAGAAVTTRRWKR